jgi:hypothetical protein
VPGLLDAVQALQTSSHSVNAVLVQLAPSFGAEQVVEPIRRWKHLQVFTRAGMEEILVAKLIATAAKQIGMFLVILAIVSAAIVALVIYTMTLGKIREIAVLKLIGTRNNHHCQHDPAAGAGAGPDRLHCGQGGGHHLGTRVPQICAAAHARRLHRIDRYPGDLRTGQHTGDSHGPQGGPSCGHWMPPVILADEPTAPLDSERALGVMRILNQMAQQAQTAIIVVTHDEKIIPPFKRIYHIQDGQTVEEA